MDDQFLVQTELYLMDRRESFRETQRQSLGFLVDIIRSHKFAYIADISFSTNSQPWPVGGRGLRGFIHSNGIYHSKSRAEDHFKNGSIPLALTIGIVRT
jgi:hypothetical protein